MLNKYKAIKTESEGILDRSEGINQLSDDIFHYIFSFLNVFDGVGLSSVSERWKDLCRTIPYLDFDIPKFCNSRNLIVDHSKIETFKDFINWALTSRSSTRIVRFQLICHNVFTQQQIFRWICVAASRNVQEAILSFEPSESFELPFSLVTCDSLRVLKLNLFWHTLQLPRSSGLCRLRCLELENIKLSDGDLARNFFSGCPLLENVSLRGCIPEDVKVLDISSSSIKYISIECGSNSQYDDDYKECAVKISCPKLLFLRYTAPIPRCYILDNLSLLENICFDPYFNNETMSDEELSHFVCGLLKVVPNAIALKLCMGFVTSLYDVRDELMCSLCMFHELKCLNLGLSIDKACMHVMMQLLKHAPILETLNLHCDEMYLFENFEFEDCSRITCLSSHLKYVQLIDFKADMYEIEFVSFILENALVLEKLTIICSCVVNIVEITETLMKFTRSSSSVTVKVQSEVGRNFDLWESL